MPSDEYLKEVTIGKVTELHEKVTLCEFNGIWAELFKKERDKIGAALSWKNISIEHVGSTSVPGLCAKPILDILLLVKNSDDESSYVPALEKTGYALKIREPD